MWWDDAAPVRSEKARLEIEGTKKMAGWIGKRDGDGLSDEPRKIGNTSGREKLYLTIIHDAVDGVCRKSIPLWPPAAAWLAKWHDFVAASRVGYDSGRGLGRRAWRRDSGRRYFGLGHGRVRGRQEQNSERSDFH